MVNKKEILESIEQTNLEKKNAILEKFEKMEKRQEENIQKNKKKLNDTKIKYQNTFEHLLINKMKLEEHKKNKIDNLLQFQIKHNVKAKQKEDEVQLSRFNAQ